MATFKRKNREIVADYSANTYSIPLIQSLKPPIQTDEYLREDTHFVGGLGDFARPPSKKKFREIVKVNKSQKQN